MLFGCTVLLFYAIVMCYLIITSRNLIQIVLYRYLHYFNITQHCYYLSTFDITVWIMILVYAVSRASLISLF